MKKIIMGVFTVCSLAIAGGAIKVEEEIAVAPEPVTTEESSAYKQSFAIYGWLPSLDGTVKYNPPGDIETSASELIDKIDSVFMGSYAVRKNKWSFLTDVIYLKMSDMQKVSGTILGSPFEASAEQKLTTWIVNAYAGYNIIQNNKHTLDVIAGMRYLSLETDIAFDLNGIHRSISPSLELYDGVIGVKGQVNLNKNWYVPYLFDIGGGDADLTAQAFTGLGYRFEWGDILLGYRYLYYDQGSDALINSLDAYGPKVGVIFHF